MTEDDVIARLVAACEDVGSQNAWAKANGVSQQYVVDVIKRRRAPGKSILKALGIERVVSYRRSRK